MTETKVAQITVKDELGYRKTFNLDNPKDNLTLGQINSALQPAFIGRWWIGTKGQPLVALDSANYAVSSKIQIAGSLVSVTPNTLATSIPLNENQTVTLPTITIEGSTIQGYSFENILTDNAFKTNNMFSATLSNDKKQLTAMITLKAPVGVSPISGTKLFDIDIAVVESNLVFTVPVTKS